MKCHDYEMFVLVLTGSQLIDVSTQEVYAAHADSCVRCATRLAEERALRDCVQAVRAEIQAEEAPAKIETALLEAFRDQLVARSSPKIVTMPARTPSRRNWKLGLAAAIVLVLISVLPHRWLKSDPHIPPHEVAIASPALIKPSEPANALVKPGAVLPPKDPVSHPQQSVRRHSRRDVLPTEKVTEFVPLMEGEDLSAFEILQVARVELPASALVDLGLTVGPEMPAGPVKADVLLGHDGMARAIRLVYEERQNNR